jgi:hypothetical protein
MTTPRYTLISFHCSAIDLTDQMQRPNDLAEVLDSTKQHRVEIYLGAYVYETRPGWQNMHQLCEFLRNRRRTFLRLPFEGEISALADAATFAALEKMGLDVYRYPDPVR